MVVVLVVFETCENHECHNLITVQNFSLLKYFIQISEHKLLHCGESTDKECLVH